MVKLFLLGLIMKYWWVIIPLTFVLGFLIGKSVGIAKGAEKHLSHTPTDNSEWYRNTYNSVNGANQFNNTNNEHNGQE